MTTIDHPAEMAAQAPAAPDPVQLVLATALGYLVSRSLHVAAALGIADLLAEGPRGANDLAAASGTHAPSLRRLLRTLAAHGIFEEQADGSFGLTPAAFLLQSGVMRDGVLLCGEVTGDGSWWNAVGHLRHAVTTGEPAFDHLHGAGFFEYIGRDPECARWFDRGLANFATHENPAVAAAYDFSDCATVVDVGGGQGGFLAQILQASPQTGGVLFDLPAVIENPAYLTSAGLDGRWQVAGGDFFEAVPAGASCYVLKRIVHDWDDAACVRILRNCRAAMGESSRLLVVDAVLPPGNAFHPGKVMDILMMVFGSGRERSEHEFADLFAQAGLRLVGVTQTPTAVAIVEARPI